MKYIYLNTASKTLTILLNNNGLIFEKRITEVSRHSEMLLPKLNELLCEHDLKISDLDVIAVNVGPGSFTGIRVGVSTVKAFLVALSVKCIAVNSLELMRYSIIKQFGELQGTGILYATPNNYYTLKFNKDNMETKHCSQEELEEFRIGKLYAFEEEKDVLNIKADYYITNNYVDEYINKEIKNGAFVSAVQLEPEYLRLSQAERELEKKNENK